MDRRVRPRRARHVGAGFPLVKFVLVSSLLVGLVGLAGCGGEFEDRTAVVEIGGSRQTYQVDSCGLDGETVFLVARAPDGSVVQGVLGLADDGATGVTPSTGLTIDLKPDTDDTRVAAVGQEAWERRGAAGPPPGAIAAARLRGSRLQFDGEVVDVDAFDRPVPGAEPQPFSVDARCDLEE